MSPHLHGVICGTQLVYNVLFGLAIKISVATAKGSDAVVVSELYEQFPIKYKRVFCIPLLTSRSHFFPHICEFLITHTNNSLKIQVLWPTPTSIGKKNPPCVYIQMGLGKVIF